MTQAMVGTGGWHADPYRRHELRFHDGTVWTEHVSDRGVPGLDTEPVDDLPRSRPPDRSSGALAPPTAGGLSARVLTDVAPGAGLLDQPVLLVDDPERAHRTRVAAEMGVRDPNGLPLGVVRVPAEGRVRRFVGRLSADDRREPRRAEVRATDGTLLLAVTLAPRRASRRYTVTDGDGAVLARIVERQRLTRTSFSIEVDDAIVATVGADRPDDPDLVVLDTDEQPVGWISRVWQVPGGLHHNEPGTHLVHVPVGAGPTPRALTLAALLGLRAVLLEAERGR